MFGASIRYIPTSKSCVIHFFASLCTTITHQPIELESCLYPQKMWQIF